MKWFPLISVALALWLLWPTPSVPRQDNITPSRSRRLVLDPKWRSKSGQDMSLAQMEQWAANLTDEELWQEIRKSSEDYLTRNKNQKWFDPPRLPVMLAREHGKRHGEQGILDLISFRKDSFADATPTDQEDHEAPYTTLKNNLNYAALAGWLDHHPEEAITRLIEIPAPDPFGSEAPNPISGLISLQLIPGAEIVALPEIWAYERVIRNTLSRYSDTSPDQAIDLLVRGSGDFLFSPLDVIGPAFSKLTPLQRNQLITALEHLDKTDRLISSQSPETYQSFLDQFEEDPDYKDVEDILADREFQTTIALNHPGIARALITRGSSPSEIKGSLMTLLCLHDPSDLSLFDQLPPQERARLTAMSGEITPRMRYGPIDGEEGGIIPDWDDYHETFIRIVRRSDIPEDEKFRHLRTLEKSWNRASE